MPGLGFNEDIVKVPPQTHEDLFGVHYAYVGVTDTTPPFFTSLGLLALIGGVRSQLSSSSCVAWALMQALALCIVGQTGQPLELSALFAYLVARLELLRELGTPGAPLEDTGSQPSMLVAGLARMGLLKESEAPFTDDPAVLNAAETITQAAAATPRIPVVIDAYALIDAPAGPARILAVRQALSAYNGAAVCLAISVDAAFDNADGFTILTAPDLSTYRGSHMVTLIGYFTVTGVTATAVDGVVLVTLADGSQTHAALGQVAVGQTVGLLLNQWGKTFAAQYPTPGLVLVDEAFINAAAWLYLVHAKVPTALLTSTSSEAA